MDILGFIPSLGNLAFTVAAFVVALSVIVAVHEYGHYIVGRWCGIRAEVFSIGFGKPLWTRTDRHGTRWQVAALPFGGYVKFLGDSDAASGKAGATMAAMDAETRRHTMHGAPLWARSATVAAGPVFNFVLSILVFAMFLFVDGIASDPLTIASTRPMPGAESALRKGDEVLTIDGGAVPGVDQLGAFIAELPNKALLDYTLRRDGQDLTVQAPHPNPALVGGINPGSAAMDAGLQVGDVIVSVDTAPIGTFADLQAAVGASDGKALALQVWREGETLSVTLTPRSTDIPTAEGGFKTQFLIGITGGLMFEPQTETPGLGQALTFGADRTLFIVQSSLSGLYHMAVGAISSCNLRGPLGIAQTSGEVASQGLSNFIWFIAVLSTAVGLLNLFPIPVLDGGHLVFHAYEAVFRRPPSDKAIKVLMTVGMALLLTLMLFALSNDLFCP